MEQFAVARVRAQTVPFPVPHPLEYSVLGSPLVLLKGSTATESMARPFSLAILRRNHALPKEAVERRCGVSVWIVGPRSSQ